MVVADEKNKDAPPPPALSFRVVGVYVKGAVPRSGSLPPNPTLKDMAQDQVLVRRRVQGPVRVVPERGLLAPVDDGERRDFWHVDPKGAHGAEDAEAWGFTETKKNDNDDDDDDDDDDEDPTTKTKERYQKSLERLQKNVTYSESVSVKNPAVYYDEYWKDLPKDVRKCYKVLGYDANKWNKGEDGGLENTEWADLTDDQRAAAKRLGFSRHSWSKWESLDEASKTAYETLGYTQQSWNAGSRTKAENTLWEQLTEPQQKACASLGWTAETWRHQKAKSSHGLKWSEHSDADREAYRVLGYDERKWTDGVPVGAEDKDWDELADDERRAAETIGWTADTWTTDDDGNPLLAEDRVFEERTVLLQSVGHYDFLRTDEGGLGDHLPDDPVADPRFGEQILIDGAVAADVRVGDVFASDKSDLVLEITSPRRGCAQLDRRSGTRFGRGGACFRANSTGAAGFYARVLVEGEVEEGATFARTASPHPHATIAYVNRALYNEGDDKHTSLGLAQWNRSKEELERLCAVKQLGWYEWKDEAQWLLDRWDEDQEKKRKRESRSLKKRGGLLASWPAISAIVVVLAAVLTRLLFVSTN